MIKDVFYPKHLLVGGIKHANKGADPNWQVAAGDTETVDGVPYTLQMTFDGKTAEVEDVTPDNILDVFVARLERWALRGHENYMYFHNLKFDLQALLWHSKYRHWFAKPQRDFVVPQSEPNERHRDAWMTKRADELNPVQEG